MNIGGSDDRRWRAVLSQDRGGKVPGALPRGCPEADHRVRHGEAFDLESPVDAPLTEAARGKPESGLGRVTDEPDPQVSQVQQVLCSHSAAVEIVDDDARELRMVGVDKDGRKSGPLDPGDLVVMRRKRHKDQPVDPFRSREVAHHGIAPFDGLDGKHDHVQPGRGDPGFDASEARDHGRGGQEGYDDRDRLGAAQREAAGDRARNVVEVGDRLEALEESVVRDPQPTALQRLHDLRVDIAHIRKTVWPLREVMSSLERGESTLISEATTIYLRDVYDHTIQLIDSLETFQEILSNLIDIYLSSVSYRLNEVMKLLTIIGTIFIPLTFIVGLYGMNFKYFPELGWRWSYPLLWVLMLSIVGVMLGYFRRRKWL